MTTATAIMFRYDGAGHFTALNERGVARCDKIYEKGEIYRQDFIEGRTEKSHRAYFAAMNHIWDGLPEKLQAEYPSETHMRRRALIKAGYCHTDFQTFDTPDDALKVAAMIRARDEYAVVVTSGCVVRIYTAKSQKKTEMPTKAEFEASKQAVLSLCAPLANMTVQDAMAKAQSHHYDDPRERYQTDTDLPGDASAPEDPPPLEQPGGSTRERQSSPSSIGDGLASEQKETPVAAPTWTFDLYLAHLAGWLRLSTSATDIYERWGREKMDIVIPAKWNPGQQARLSQMVLERARQC